MIRTAAPASDTIVAPATPPGDGGIGIVRLSGPQAEQLLGGVFRGRLAPAAMASHRLYHGRLCDAAGRPVDEVLAVIMRAPRSYTGEDVVEVHCHGGSQLLRCALDLFLAAGARLARPGEFTERAFLNGRLDLAQAEAVAALIGSRSARAARAALAQLDGRLSQQLYRYTAELRELLLLLEAHIDFPDDDLGPLDGEALVARTRAVRTAMTGLLHSFDTGRVLREGLNVLILGRPNVGKSSLLNALLGEARAIVTDIPGTTRDTIEEQLVLGGLPLRLVDTAGVRATDDPIELEGVRRAREKVAAADLVLLVIDGARPLNDEDRMALAMVQPARTILVRNKCDLPPAAPADELAGFPCQVAVSVRQGTGLDALQAAVVAHFSATGDREAGDGVVLTERRHREALAGALQALDRFLAAQAAAEPAECLAMELREALAALGQITGETTPDLILEQIFSRFCIGK
ncbi:MAG: tRNA uridine-5-carboxymethylaminomethyl(34) synthesis GTPase MnmE [Deltaproteobacteria bacterium]|nr:MAG: tRNA uridine-5-carboxymethylaminomethyl(34) synthesis GTPase MnmE [Deltaproteobacteria bacterium]